MRLRRMLFGRSAPPRAARAAARASLAAAGAIAIAAAGAPRAAARPAAAAELAAAAAAAACAAAASPRRVLARLPTPFLPGVPSTAQLRAVRAHRVRLRRMLRRR